MAALTILLRLMIAAQAVLAGAYLSGFPEARLLHRSNGMMIGLVAIVILIRAMMTRRHVPRAVALVMLIAMQAALGMAYVEGGKTLWLHIPLGMMLFGLVEDFDGQWKGARRDQLPRHANT